jgi:hypothetical protein
MCKVYKKIEMLLCLKYKIKFYNMQENNLSFEVYSYYNEKAKLPNKDFHISHQHIKLPFCDAEIIKKVINNVLAKIEGLRGEYNEEEYMWNLEYGTKPLEETINRYDFKLKEIIQTKKFWALLASRKAFEQFHKNDYDYGFEDNYTPLSFSLLCASKFSVKSFTNRKWSNIHIFLTYDEKENIIFVGFHRANGDRDSFYIVSKIIENALTETNFC